MNCSRSSANRENRGGRTARGRAGGDRRTNDGESASRSTTGSCCSTPLPAAGRAEMEAGRRSPDGGRTGGAGRTLQTEDFGCTSRRPLLPTGRHGQMAGTSRDGRRRRRPRWRCRRPRRATTKMAGGGGRIRDGRGLLLPSCEQIDDGRLKRRPRRRGRAPRDGADGSAVMGGGQRTAAPDP